MSGSPSPRDAVLIPAGNKLKSYACMRSLHRRGIHTIVASEFEQIPHFSSRYCSERIHLPSPPSVLTAYKDALLDIATRPDVRTIVPVRECDAYVFAAYGDEFAKYVTIVAPPLGMLRKAHDRLQLAEEAEAVGVPFARTQSLSDVDEVDGPAVVKSRYNVLTSEYVDGLSPDDMAEVKGVRFLQPGDELDADAIRAEMGHNPVVQEFVPEAEKHLYCALWDHGEPIATYQHEQLRKNSWVGGGGVYRVSTYSRGVDAVANELLSHLEWHGFACIEYVKHETTGEWTFLEINPRIWQSLPEAVRANADFPYYYWLSATRRPDRIDPSYELGVACHNLYGEVAHLLSIRRDESPFVERPSFHGTLWEMVTSLVRNPRFEYIRRDDPRFVLGCMRSVLSTGVTGSRRFASGDVLPEQTAESDRLPHLA